MDIQLTRGLLEICVLKILSRGESYGYQIVKDASECIEISESTLYPILKRLESGGLVSARSAEHNGRLRRYFRITPAGNHRIEQFLEEWEEVMRVYEFIKENGRDKE